MILAIDIGNTNIKLGMFENDKLIFRSRLSTDRMKTKDEYAIEFSSIFSVYGINKDDISGSVMSCVVPSISYQIRKAVTILTGKPPIEVGNGAKINLDVKIDNPETLGADLIVSCVACSKLYDTPCIIISLGTATTFSVLDRNKCMRGGAIMPGVSLSLNALTHSSSLLPSVEFDTPSRVIGTNTVDCLRSGSIIGTACMIDGMCSRIEAELGEQCTVIATGGLSSIIVPHCNKKIIHSSDLIMHGLKIIYDMNKN